MRILAAALLLWPALAVAGPSPLDRPMPPNERGAELSAAIAAATPGTLIELETGTYTGRFVVAQKPDVTIRAKAGAHVVLTHRDPRFAGPNTLWTPIPGSSVYRIPEVIGSSIYRLTGERILYGKTLQHFGELVADGIPSAFRTSTETLLYLSGEDPRRTPLWVSADDGPVLACDHSARLRLEGLDVRFGGAVGINLEAGCDGSVIDAVSVYGGRDGIRLKDGLSSGVTVRRSWIANHIDRRWFYRDVKGNPIIEGSALQLPGIGQVAEENVIQGWFNGIATFCFVPTCAAVDPALRRNLIEDILDDAVELDGVTVRGEVAENLIRNAFVGFSFAPRQVRAPGEDTRVHHNAVQTTRRTLNDRDGSVLRPSLTKFNGAAARDLVFDHNTAVGEGDLARGAPSGTGVEYPIRVRWFANVLVSRSGPLVRHTGSPADGNLFESNAYFLREPAPNAFTNWALPLGEHSSHATLAAARSSPAGQAAGWEAFGIEADPLLARADEPSSLRAGSPAQGRGAFEPAPRRVDATVRLPTGWVLVRGVGFDSDGRGLGILDPIVVSSTTAFGRDPDPVPAPPRLISVDVVP